MQLTTEQNLFLELMENIPLSPNDYYNYLKYYIHIIDLLISRCTHYGHTELILKRLENTLNVNYNKFNKILKEGEQISLWGLYKVNGYNVLYLKRKAFKIFLGVDKTHTPPERITTQMLARSVLKLSLKVDKLEQFKMSNSDSLYIYYKNNQKKFIYISLSNKIMTNYKKGETFRTELITHINKDKSLTNNIVFYSPYEPSNASLKYFLEDGFKINVLTYDIFKYFNGLPI